MGGREGRREGRREGGRKAGRDEVGGYEKTNNGAKSFALNQKHNDEKRRKGGRKGGREGSRTLSGASSGSTVILNISLRGATIGSSSMPDS